MKKVLLFVVAFLAANSVWSQWEPDVRLTNDPDSSITAYNMSGSIAAIDDFVHVVWYDNRNGNWEIYYKRSTNSGISWDPDTRLTIMPNTSRNPSIAVSDTNVHVTWDDSRDGNREIYYKRSTDGGLNWGADIRLTDDPAISYMPSISISGTVVHLVWVDVRDGHTEIYYKQSTNGGLSWEPDVRLTNDGYDSYNPSIASSGTDVHIVWNDWRDVNVEIYYKRSTDGGIYWEPDYRLTNAIMDSWLPSIGVSGSELHIVWSDAREIYSKIYYKRSQNGGDSWDEDKRLTDVGNITSTVSNLAVSGQIVNVVWEDNREGNFHIYYKRSEDGGENWAADTLISDSGSMSSKRPSVALSGSMVHVVWYDDRDWNEEIYYKRNPTGSGAILSVTPTNQNVTAVAGTTAFTVTSNRDWSAQSDATWCTVTSFGSGNGTILAEYTENISDQPRIATIHVKVDTLLERIVTVNQSKSTIGIEDLSESAVRIYPNPASSILHIQFDGIPNGQSILTIWNILGETLITMPIRSDEVMVDISVLPDGIYFVEISTRGNKAESQKLVIWK